MTQDNPRRNVIAAIGEARPVGGKVDYTAKDIREVYCEHVFNDPVQRQRLPKAIYQALQKTIRAGHELDPAIADPVALAMRDWARRDPQVAAVVEEVDTWRLECTRKLFVASGLSDSEAKSRSLLLYAYVFGFSMMQCGQFPMNAAETKRWIMERITQ